MPSPPKKKKAFYKDCTMYQSKYLIISLLGIN